MRGDLNHNGTKDTTTGVKERNEGHQLSYSSFAFVVPVVVNIPIPSSYLGVLGVLGGSTLFSKSQTILHINYLAGKRTRYSHPRIFPANFSISPANCFTSLFESPAISFSCSSTTGLSSFFSTPSPFFVIAT